MLIEKIKADSIEARKAKETVKANLLVTLLAEVTKVGKDKGNRATTDEEAIAVIKKFLKGVEETLQALDANLNSVAKNYFAVVENAATKNLPAEEAMAGISPAANALTVVKDNINVANAEIDILHSYLPKQLTKEELEAIIKNLNTKNVGEIMKHLKDNYSGVYDGKLASEIAKGL